MSEAYRCIVIELYDKHPGVTIDHCVQVIHQNFVTTANCHIHTEQYKRSENNLFITIEVRGDVLAVNAAILHTKDHFKTRCDSLLHNEWFQ